MGMHPGHLLFFCGKICIIAFGSTVRDGSIRTKSTLSFPTYLYENNRIYVSPSSITSGLEVNYVRQPSSVAWGFTVGQLGQYVFNDDVNFSSDFELHRWL